QINNVTPGTSAAGHGGGRLRVSGQYSALLEGDTDGVFSITGLETLEFVPDPDLPHGPGSWQTVERVAGAGPIDIEPLEVLDISLRFACPGDPAKESFSASVAVVDRSRTTVMRIPITATVLPERLTISLTQVLNVFNPGQTQTLDFQFDSSFRHDIT